MPSGSLIASSDRSHAPLRPRRKDSAAATSALAQRAGPLTRLMQQDPAKITCCGAQEVCRSYWLNQAAADSAASDLFAARFTPSKSPRMALSAARSCSISCAVRKPKRRSTGTGGHQPWVACWKRKAVTRAGRSNHRRSEVTPNATPVKARREALASIALSMSHSSSSSRRRLEIPLGSAAKCRTRRTISSRIRSLTSAAVWAGTRSTVLVTTASFEHQRPGKALVQPPLPCGHGWRSARCVDGCEGARPGVDRGAVDPMDPR